MRALARTHLTAAAAAAAGLALTRAARLGLGLTERAGLEAVAASAAALAAGCLDGRAPGKVLTWGAAVAAALVMVFAGRFEAELCRLVELSGEGWRQDISRAGLALLLTGLPFYAGGRILAGAGAGAAGYGLAGCVLGLTILDAPAIPRAASSAAALVAPFVLAPFAIAAAARRRDDDGGEEEERVKGWTDRAACARDVLLAGSAVLAVLVVRVELRSFVRGTWWDLAQMDVMLLTLALVGYRFVGPPLHAAGAGAPPLAALLVCGAACLSSWRLASLASSPLDFHALVKAIGSATLGLGALDGPAYPAALVAVSVPVLALVAGAVLCVVVHGDVRSERRGMARAATGAALAAVLGLTLGGGSSAAGSASVAAGGLRGLTTLSFFGAAAAALAGAGAALARRRGRGAAGACALSALTTAAAVLAPRIEFRPSSLFNTQERGVPERHAILGVEESLEGIALVVEAPDWKDLTVPLRTDRVRLDRVDQTPCLDGVATADLALTLALELHPAPKRVLVLGELAAGSEARLRAAGVAEIVKTDTPFASGSAPAGMRGFDVVFAPPRPRFQATPAWTLEPLHAAAICRCIAPGGVLAIFASASTTPSAVLTDLRDGWLASAVKPTVKPFVALVANGLLEPAVGLLVRDGGAPPPEDGPVELRGLTQSRSLPPFAPCRAFETVGFGDRFSETRRACAAESVEWFVETVKTYGADARAARGQLELAGALAAFHRAPWRFNSFRPPADQVPVPDGVLDSLVKAVSESPALWPRAGAAARQVGALLTAQRSFSRLLDFSRKILDVKPDAWHARRDLARAHRELLDPETALSILEGAPSATDAEGAVALAVERSRVQIALVRAPSAVQGLREALTTRPTSLPLLEALVDAYLAAGDAAQAVVTAKHHASLTGGDASSEALLRRANAAGGAASRGAAGR